MPHTNVSRFLFLMTKSLNSFKICFLSDMLKDKVAVFKIYYHFAGVFFTKKNAPKDFYSSIFVLSFGIFSNQDNLNGKLVKEEGVIT